MVTNIAIKDTTPATIPTMVPASNPPELLLLELVLELELEVAVPGAVLVVDGADPVESDNELVELGYDNDGGGEDVLEDTDGAEFAIAVLVNAEDVVPSKEKSTDNG